MNRCKSRLTVLQVCPHAQQTDGSSASRHVRPAFAAGVGTEVNGPSAPRADAKTRLDLRRRTGLWGGGGGGIHLKLRGNRGVVNRIGRPRAERRRSVGDRYGVGLSPALEGRHVIEAQLLRGSLGVRACDSLGRTRRGGTTTSAPRRESGRFPRNRGILCGGRRRRAITTRTLRGLRPHVQENRTNPSPEPSFGVLRRTRIFDEHRGQITRSGPSAGTLKASVHNGKSPGAWDRVA